MITVAKAFGNNSPSGLFFGVEIEVEGKNLIGIPSVEWKSKPEGSLRGECIEYVFKKPLPFHAAVDAVNNAYRAFEIHGTQIDDSFRAGTHVHVNVGDLTFRQLSGFLFLFYIFEEVLVDLCGENRVGNHHSLRLYDTYGAVMNWQKAFSNQKIAFVTRTGHKYAAANLITLAKFCTVEFRFLPTYLEAEPLIEWLHVFRELYNKGIDYDIFLLLSVVDNMTSEEIVNFFFDNMPEFKDKILSVPNFDAKLARSVSFLRELVWSCEEKEIDWNFEFKSKMQGPTIDSILSPGVALFEQWITTGPSTLVETTENQESDLEEDQENQLEEEPETEENF